MTDEQQSVKETVQDEQEPKQPLKAFEQEFKLRRKWTWWYLNDERLKQWEERLKNVHTFTSVSEFWALFDAIKPPSGLNLPADYMLFRDGIQPMSRKTKTEAVGSSPLKKAVLQK
uniref:EIF-4F 25 kDa subunit n=1 Tax=Caenorhabditis japonica TaxID=281687 RepID=A0A8R1IZ97_CAEJA